MIGSLLAAIAGGLIGLAIGLILLVAVVVLVDRAIMESARR